MPVIESWSKHPLNIIQGIYENNRDDKKCFPSKVEQYFLEKLKNKNNLTEILSLNDISISKDHLKEKTLVRFRCMIQETMEPEFFLDTYQVTSKQSQDTHIYSSMYQDTISCADGMEISENPSCETASRQVLYCIPIPGESSWVKHKYTTKYPSAKTGEKESDQLCSGSKRPNSAIQSDLNSDIMAKRIRLGAESSSTSALSTSAAHLKYPLPNEKGPLCIVKVYNENMEFKVNDLYEFVGILSFESQSLHNYETAKMEEANQNNAEDFLLPTLHCVAMEKLNHCNPILDNIFLEKDSQDFFNNAQVVRQELVQYLSKALFGDELAAEYLLSNLVSNVYLNTDTMAVGKLSLNLSKIPPGTVYPKLLANFISNLVCKIHYLPMTLDNMNMLKFIPTKNYSTESLESGLLQLSEASHLFVDETLLMPGQLDTNGVKNIQSLATLIKMQKVDYDFKFHSIPFYHSVKVLVLSEGKSMLPSDCQVPLIPTDVVPNDIDGYFSSLSLPENILDKFRAFLTISHCNSYEVEESMVTSIENDFVNTRQRNGRDSMSPDDLHLQLTLARSLCKSSGIAKLDASSWEKAKDLERLRKSRL